MACKGYTKNVKRSSPRRSLLPSITAIGIMWVCCQARVDGQTNSSVDRTEGQRLLMQIERAQAELEERLEDGVPAPAELLKWAKWAAEQYLLVEADQMVKAVLLLDPQLNKAQSFYDELGKKKLPVELAVTDVRTVNVDRSGACEACLAARRHDGSGTDSSGLIDARLVEHLGCMLKEVGDAGYSVQAPAGHLFQLVPIQISVEKKKTYINADNLRGVTSEGTAEFVGFRLRSDGPIKGQKKRDNKDRRFTGRARSGSDDQGQIWEVLKIRKKAKKTEATFKNKNKPVPPTPREAKKTALPYVMRSSRSFFTTELGGPYSAIFAVPEDQSLTHIRFKDELPEVVFPPGSRIDHLAIDPAADLEVREQAVRRLISSQAFDALLRIYEDLLREGEPTLVLAAMQGIRKAGRQRQTVQARFVSSINDSRLVDFEVENKNFRETRVTEHVKFDQYGEIPRSRRTERKTIRYTRGSVETNWNIKNTGDYRCCIQLYAVPASDGGSHNEWHTTVSGCSEDCSVSKPGSVRWSLTLPEAFPETVNLAVVELWQHTKLIELKLLIGRSAPEKKEVRTHNWSSLSPQAKKLKLPISTTSLGVEWVPFHEAKRRVRDKPDRHGFDQDVLDKVMVAPTQLTVGLPQVQGSKNGILMVHFSELDK